MNKERRFTVGGEEKTFANMNSIEQDKLANDICMTQPLGKRGLNEYMGEEYANDVILNRTATEIKKDIKWFQEMIINGRLHRRLGGWLAKEIDNE